MPGVIMSVGKGGTDKELKPHPGPDPPIEMVGLSGELFDGMFEVVPTSDRLPKVGMLPFEDKFGFGPDMEELFVAGPTSKLAFGNAEPADEVADIGNVTGSDGPAVVFGDETSPETFSW